MESVCRVVVCWFYGCLGVVFCGVLGVGWGRRGCWWARGDLNPGPPPCKGGVLTRLDDGPAPWLLGFLVVVVNVLRLWGCLLFYCCSCLRLHGIFGFVFGFVR